MTDRAIAEQDSLEGLIARLREFEISDALGNGDFSVCAEAADTLSQMRAEIAELRRQLGGGCEANNGAQHTVIKQGNYAFCGDCGESLKGVRFNHVPATTTKIEKE